jgi:hypothetical protein
MAFEIAADRTMESGKNLSNARKSFCGQPFVLVRPKTMEMSCSLISSSCVRKHPFARIQDHWSDDWNSIWDRGLGDLTEAWMSSGLAKVEKSAWSGRRLFRRLRRTFPYEYEKGISLS